MDVLQKLLAPRVAAAIVNQGHTAVEGPVVRAADVTSLSTPEALLSAYGFDGSSSPWGDLPEYVDVLRFPVDPLMRLDKPVDTGERPWPTYPSGFLPGGDVVPVWILQRTRVPIGAEYWRISATGEQQGLSTFAGPAMGWRAAKGYFPPLHLVGPRAEWNGLDLPAALVPDSDDVELVHVGRDSAPEGFEEGRPQVWRRVVPVAECARVFELVLTAEVSGVPVRILQRAGAEALVLLLSDDPAAVQDLQAREVEPGVFETVVPAERLSNAAGTTRELPALSS